jgi:hypothetical protein
MEANELYNALTDALGPIEALTAPHVLYRPEVISGRHDLNDKLRYVAVHHTSDIRTFGETPGEALRRFDQAWHGKECGCYLGRSRPWSPAELERIGPNRYGVAESTSATCTLPATHEGECRDENEEQD